MIRVLFILAITFSVTARAEFRTLRVRALASAGLRPDASRLAHLTVTVVASDDEFDCSVFLSAEETAMGKPVANSDIKTTIESPYGLVRLSVVDLGPFGEAVLLCYEAGTRVRFAIYGVGDHATPISLLSGTADSAPFIMRLSHEGSMVCVKTHETGDFSRYYLALYGVRDGALKAVRAFEADEKTSFELRGFVRELPPAAFPEIATSIGGGSIQVTRGKAAEPGATDNPDDAQRLREDH